MQICPDTSLPAATASSIYDQYSIPSSPPVEKLPIELLEQIFDECIRDPGRITHIVLREKDFQSDGAQLGTSPHEIHSQPTPEWISITHVCRLWRKICLHCPRFWTHITASLSQKWVAAYLERSRTQPLTIELETPVVSIGHIVTLFTSTAPRLKVFSIKYRHGRERAKADGPIKDLCQAFSVPAPLLESFVLDVYIKYPYEIKDGLFSGDAPCLRVLELGRGIAVSPSSSILRNLRSLDVTSGFDVDEMLALLQCTPLLESLAVRGFIRYLGSEPPQGVLVRLPHLAWVSIESIQVKDFVELFDRLWIHPAVHVQVQVIVKEEDEVEAMLDILGNSIHRVEKAVGPLYLAMGVEPEGDWYLSCYPISQSLYDHAMVPEITQHQHLLASDAGWHRRCEHAFCNGPFVCIVYRYKHHGDIYEAVSFDLQRLFDRLVPIAVDVHGLRLNLALYDEPKTAQKTSAEAARYMTATTWTPILHVVSDVRILKLTPDTVVGVLMAFHSSQVPLLPKLTTLVIEKTALTLPEIHYHPSAPDMIELLERFLSRRLEIGLALERLVIHDDEYEYYGEERVMSLKKYVKDIAYSAVDEEIEYESDEDDSEDADDRVENKKLQAMTA
ncbi:hypothetical protein HETIRDRAFT_444811 [Heterobasidion irregulare TC 32-1]|uniref:Uncharacterized protein n=1 Tax=Heterobasidion irregulare (strain TC 32-1) TaxID=747525 RepID=W4K842_HETIT|nr:uncharacterized protein HETIRDRAFT_444811 [Heterobasidion irregulare TC 32-1]ETW81520.1 hypothetical protein HETIRDRAFT_444811 [Heterobasidion irregulare TC 32-1]